MLHSLPPTRSKGIRGRGPRSAPPPTKKQCDSSRNRAPSFTEIVGDSPFNLHQHLMLRLQRSGWHAFAVLIAVVRYRRQSLKTADKAAFVAGICALAETIETSQTHTDLDKLWLALPPEFCPKDKARTELILRMTARAATPRRGKSVPSTERIRAMNRLAFQRRLIERGVKIEHRRFAHLAEALPR